HRALSEHKTLSISWSHYPEDTPMFWQNDHFYMLITISKFISKIILILLRIFIVLTVKTHKQH
ncbi:hypothetical protein, partial [Klebsiella pneumoniae]|uniref:hypothetical protein n=1 Tax=Klebsiella pneumoniae TaxID=573 RepID=UPI001CB74669